MRRFALSLVVLSLLIPFAQTQDVEALGDPLGRIYLSEHLKTADYDAYAAGLIRLIEADPTQPTARIALERCVDLESALADPRPVYAMLLKFAKNDFKDCGRWSPEYADAYTRFARRYDTTNSWHAVSQRWRGITQAAYIGPFTDGAAPAHDDAFGPEVMLDFAAEYDGAYGRVKWQPVKHHDPVGGKLAIYDQQRWTGYGYYVATQVVSAEDKTALLLLDVSGPAKVWVNGKQEADLVARGEDLPEAWPMDVSIKRGVNTLLVKISALTAIQMRLLGADYQPLTGVEARVPKPDSKPIAMKAGKRLARQYRADRVDLFEDADDALSRLAAAENCDLYGLSHESAAHRDAAVAESDDALVKLEFLRTLDDNQLHSYSAKRRMTRSLTDALIAEHPGMVPALLKKAELLGDDERYRDAIALLDSALEHAAQKWRVHLAKAQVFSDARWRAEEESALKAALKDAPKAIPVLKAVSERLPRYMQVFTLRMNRTS